MEEPTWVQAVDDVGVLCMVLTVFALIYFFYMTSSWYTVVILVYCLFGILLVMLTMACCNICYQRMDLPENYAYRAAAIAAINAAVVRLGQPSLTAGVMSDGAQAASSAPNNTNTSNPISTSNAGNNNASDTSVASNNNTSDSNAADTANVSYGFGDSPPAVRLTLVIEGDGHVRLAPMPVEQASALRPVNERVGLGAGGGEGGGEHVAGMLQASYSTQVQIHNSNNNDGNASHGGGAGRGGGEEGAQYVGHGREGTCEAAAGEGGNEMSDDALYGRSAYIPCTAADVNAAASAATEVVMVPVEQTAQEMQPSSSSSQAAAAAAEDHGEGEDVAKKPAAEANAEV